MFQVEHDKFDIKRHFRGVYLSCIIRRFNGENKKKKQNKKKKKNSETITKQTQVCSNSVTSFNQSKCCYHGQRQQYPVLFRDRF